VFFNVQFLRGVAATDEKNENQQQQSGGRSQRPESRSAFGEQRSTLAAQNCEALNVPQATARRRALARSRHEYRKSVAKTQQQTIPTGSKNWRLRCTTEIYNCDIIECAVSFP